MWTRLIPLAFLTALLVAGCGGGPTNAPHPAGTAPAGDSAVDEAAIQANLAKLGPEDRKLAEEQEYCANEPDSRLGSMGPPVKVVLKDQPVFLCCGHCKGAAQADPDKTLAKVKELKARHQATQRQ